MSLEFSKPPRRPVDTPRDKPLLERVGDHGNLDRPGAMMHPRAQAASFSAQPRGWEHYANRVASWR